MNHSGRVLTGSEVLRTNQFAQLKGKRVGLFTNLNAIDGDLVSTYDILRRTVFSLLRQPYLLYED